MRDIVPTHTAKKSHSSAPHAALSRLPKVDSLLSHPLLAPYPKARLLPIVREQLASLRAEILKGEAQDIESRLHSLPHDIAAKVKAAPSLKRVINATGVVAHTNLGRSVFSRELLDEITPYLCHYHTLEYDITQGARSERYAHSTQMLCEMLGCEDALIVNNNAAAVLLILNTFAAGREVIISRGELVEIGGSFRIPEVMRSATSLLCEVGTSNKTHLRDYERAINERSAMIMKTHQSNFTQLGFVGSCSMRELSLLARRHNLVDYYDLGSGYMGEALRLDEPSLREVLRAKPSLVSFSGDKLLGGPQAGIILGRAELIRRLKENQLLRALRVDKFTLLALQATLQAYRDKCYHKIPTIALLSIDKEELKARAEQLLGRITHALESHADSVDSKMSGESCADSKVRLKAEVVRLESLAGGGSVPHLSFESYGLALQIAGLSAKALEAAMRARGLIACVRGESILLDVRTLLDGESERVAEIVCEICECAGARGGKNG